MTEKPLTKLEKRYLSRFTCGWCDQRLDREICGSVCNGWSRCSAEQRDYRRKFALLKYKPKPRKAKP
jgi:hypothetical protein